MDPCSQALRAHHTNARFPPGPSLPSCKFTSHAASETEPGSVTGPACASRRRDALLNILGLLAGPELDDAEMSQPVLAEGIFPDYGLDLLQVLAHRQDDPAFPRYLSPRDEEVAGRIILVQEADVRPHVCVDVLEAGLVDELDDRSEERRVGKECRSPWAAGK